MTTKPPDFSDLNTLAIEACDMWQDHLSNLAGNAEARAELTRFLEPQRRLFADWALMMQQNNPVNEHEPGSAPQSPKSTHRGHTASEAAATSARGAPYGDDALRVAQLALRVAELEERITRLESAAASTAQHTNRTSS